MSKENIIDRNHPHLADYQDIVELFPDAVFITDGERAFFKTNRLVYWLKKTKNVNMNELAVAYDIGAFTLKDYVQFHMDIGYGLCGFTEIFGNLIEDMQKKKITFRDLVD